MTQNPIHHILQNNNHLLRSLFLRLHELRQLNAILASYLDSLLAQHCQVVNIQNNCLIVITDSSNWLTQLRFQIPELLPKLRQHPELQNIQAICGKTRPDYQPVPRHRPRKAKRLSQNAADSVLQQAEGIEDSALREIMKKIAERS